MKITIAKALTFNGILYLIVLFLIIWNNLQIAKPTIPFNTAIFYVLILYLLYRKRKLSPSNTINNTPILLKVLLLGLLMLVFKIQIDENYSTQILSFFPIFLVAICLEKATKQDLMLSRFAFLFFVLLNCCLIFYERKTMTVLLWNSEDYALGRNDITDLTMFRASGFTGHPVLGGFLLSIELAFVQLSRLNQKVKYVFTVLIFFALLCVNSRANILLSAFVSIYLFRDAIISKKNRIIKILLISLAFFFFYNLITTTDYGGRLINHESGLDDSSTMARFEVFSVFDYINWNQLLWGDLGLSDYLMAVMGLAGIENGYIVLVLKYGLIFGGLLIFLLTKYQWQALHIYSKEGRLILFFLFIILANTNPHIAHAVPWVFWVASYYLLRPSFKKNNI